MRDKVWIVAFAALVVVGLSASSAAWALGNCPRGEWAPEEGICVLCLPGYSPQPTGNTTGPPNNFACYSCQKDSDSAVGDGDDGGALVCEGDPQPIGEVSDLAPELDDAGDLGTPSAEPEGDSSAEAEPTASSP